MAAKGLDTVSTYQQYQSFDNESSAVPELPSPHEAPSL